MTILVDDRAGSKDLVKHPPLDTLGQLCRLHSGDVCFQGNGSAGPVLVGIEVKSVLDLLASLNTGRLQATQLPRMMADYDVNWLLYYGTYRPNPKSGALQIRKRVKGRGPVPVWVDYSIGAKVVPYGYHEAFLVSPSFTQTGVLSKRVFDLAEAAYWIGVLYRTWQRPYSSHKSMRTFDKSREVSVPGMDTKTEVRAKMCSAWPGVGYEKAVAIAMHFTSARAMVNAGVEELAEVQMPADKNGRRSRVGKVVAKAIVEVVT